MTTDIKVVLQRPRWRVVAEDGRIGVARDEWAEGFECLTEDLEALIADLRCVIDATNARAA